MPINNHTVPGHRAACNRVAICALTLLFASILFASNSTGATNPQIADSTPQAAESNSIFMLRQKATQGDAGAQFELGLTYDGGNRITKDRAEAVKWYRKAAEQGHADAQYMLAFAHARGDGATHNMDEAFMWWSKAARQGHVVAQSTLAQEYYKRGLAYAHGENVAQNWIEALKWWHAASELGHVEAQFTLGTAYEYGVKGIIEGDTNKAANWYHKAAEQGMSMAQVALGDLYYVSKNVDKKESIYWFGRACKQGNNDAKITLAMLYADGGGERATNNFSRGINWGNADAQRRLLKVSGMGSATARLLAKHHLTQVVSGITDTCKQLMNGRITLDQAQRLLIVRNEEAADKFEGQSDFEKLANFQERLNAAVAMGLAGATHGSAMDAELKMPTLMEGHAVYADSTGFAVALKWDKAGVYPQNTAIPRGYYKIVGVKEFTSTGGTRVQYPVVERVE